METECNTSHESESPTPESPANGPSHRLRFRRRSLLISTLAIGAVLAMAVPAIQTARRAAQRERCSFNLRQINLGLWLYHEYYKTYPPAITYAPDGTPMHSWRVAILPGAYVGPIYDRYNFRESWNGPHNRMLGDAVPDTYSRVDGTTVQSVYIPPIYRCPSAQATQSPMCTNYVMLIDDRPSKPNGPPHLAGSVPPSFDDKSAVIIIEIADSDIHWMEPRDVLLSELSMKINDRSKRSLSSYHGGACVLHADGSVEILDEATTEERVRELLTQ